MCIESIDKYKQAVLFEESYLSINIAHIDDTPTVTQKNIIEINEK